MHNISRPIASRDEFKIVALLQALIAGKQFDTGRLRLAEFIWNTAERTDDGLGTLSLCLAIERVIRCTKVKYFVCPPADANVQNNLDEFFKLCTFTSSRYIAIALWRQRIAAYSDAIGPAFDERVGKDLVNCIANSCDDPSVAACAVELCGEPFYQKYIGFLYFSLLELSPNVSIEIFPQFITHYSDLRNGLQIDIYHKNFAFFFSTRAIRPYAERLSPILRAQFWTIISRTNITDELSARIDFDRSGNGSSSQSKTRDIDDIKVLSPVLASSKEAAQRDMQRMKQQANDQLEMPAKILEAQG